jgi:cytochrome c-type biogenesis protein CcmH/NrfG
MADFYAVLQVPRDADQPTIDAAYQRLRGAYDPANLGNVSDELRQLATERLIELERAYTILGDTTLRAAYDAGISNVVERALPQQADPVYDYLPLAPASAQERDDRFEVEPVLRNHRSMPNEWNRRLPLILAVTLPFFIVISTFFLTDGGTRIAPVNTAEQAQVNALEQFEQAIAAAKAVAENKPEDAQAWIDYGNMLYNSVQVVRELQPGSPFYQSRVARWQMAADAYSKSLVLVPGDVVVLADLGASQCFYGNDTGDQALATQGLQQLRLVIDQIPVQEQPRVLLNFGYCLAESSPPRVEEAIATWQKINTLVPADSPFAVQANKLIRLLNR